MHYLPSTRSNNDCEPSVALEQVGGNRMFWGLFVVPDSIIPIACKFSITSMPGLGHQGSSAHVLQEPTRLTGAA